MKLWMKRISVFLITLMTLGMYTPPIDLNTNTDNEEIISTKTDGSEEITSPLLEVEQEGISKDVPEHDSDYVIGALTEQAKAHTIAKLGPRIASKIEPDFAAAILPNIEEVLHMILAEAGEDAVNYYGISTLPAKGYGERIFNIHDYQARRDVARFDVRRENRPDDGYWFNFHYHLNDDEFEAHHPIGEIYWDKNMPPKWMA